MGGHVTANISCPGSSAAARTASSSSTPECRDSDGKKVPCTKGDRAWNQNRHSYCRSTYFPLKHDSTSPTGLILESCDNDTIAHPFSLHPVYTPRTSQPETLIRNATTTLNLQPPTIGIGAYTYPGEEQWGLTWWIGAPMWLWIDTLDTTEWGTHHLTLTEGDTTINATITATHVTYTTGDNTPPTICHGPGTPRPWKPSDLLNRPSPSHCEHTYLTLNEQGNPNSRYTITATTTWTITWTTNYHETGTFTLDIPSTNNPTVHIGEIRVLRTNPPGR